MSVTKQPQDVKGAVVYWSFVIVYDFEFFDSRKTQKKNKKNIEIV